MDKPHNFTVGDKISMEDLTEEQARAVFGGQVYEAWRDAKTKGEPKEYQVLAVDQSSKAITLGVMEYRPKCF